MTRKDVPLMIGSLITAVLLGSITITLTGLYLLPMLLAWARHMPDIGSIAVINILLGWTLAGWVVALALALRSDIQPNPGIQLVQHLPFPAAPGTDWTGQPAQPGRQPAAAPPLHLPPMPQEPGPPPAGDDQWTAQPW
jgi:hypothetical protein